MSVIFSIFSDFISVDILIDTSKGKWETLLVKIFHFWIVQLNFLNINLNQKAFKYNCLMV